MSGLVGDVRYAWRLLLRSPGYALVAVAVLALGIGANTVAFGYYQALALSPLPGVTGSADIQVIAARSNGGRIVGLSHRDFRDLQGRMQAYSGVAGSDFIAFTLGRGAAARRITAEAVTGNYFELLGVTAQLGRVLTAADDVTPRGHPVAVLSDTLWRRRFAADRAIVGRTIELNNVPITVVGVAHSSFHGTVVGIDIELFMPVMMLPALSAGYNALEDPRAQMLFGLARPREGISAAQARADVQRAGTLLDAERPNDELGERAVAIRIADSPQGLQTYGGPLVWLMGGTAALLLVVVCANVAGLVLVRTVGRRGEIAARLSLGATPARVGRLLLLEALLVAVPGAALGLLMPQLADPYLTSARSAISVPIYVHLDTAPIAIIALLLAFVSAVLCGFLPGVRASRLDLASAMKDGLSPRAPSVGRLRSTLVVCQVAMSLVLLVGTALVVRSLNAAREASPGFDPRDVATVVIDLRPAGYGGLDGYNFYRRLLDDLRAMDGVEAVSLMRTPLLMVWDFGGRLFAVEGHARGAGDDFEFGFNIVSSGHFRTLKIPLIAGRDFHHDEPPQRVAIVNETLARRFWGSPGNAIGRRLETADWTTFEPVWMTIVGVARDIKYTRLNEEPRPYVYLPFSQAFAPAMAIEVRAAGASPALLDRIRRHIGTLDPAVPIIEARMMAEQTNLGFALYDAAARVLVFIGAAAIALASIGIYGMVAYTVKQSAHEIGIRMAVGAPRGHIVQRYAAGGVRVGAIGAVIGIAGALSVTRLITSLLYGVRPTDVLSFAAATALVVSAALAASLVPAWRASRVDPLVTLRNQ